MSNILAASLTTRKNLSLRLCESVCVRALAQVASRVRGRSVDGDSGDERVRKFGGFNEPRRDVSLPGGASAGFVTSSRTVVNWKSCVHLFRLEK